MLVNFGVGFVTSNKKKSFPFKKGKFVNKCVLNGILENFLEDQNIRNTACEMIIKDSENTNAVFRSQLML